MDFPDKITVIRKINEGNFGQVFLCENNFLNKRKEAVKVIQLKDEDINKLKDNLFESSVLEYLRRSEYIVNIYNADVLSNGFAIHMEYMEEGSVQNLLDKHGHLSTYKVSKIAECVLQALEYAHNKNIFHLDIKPGNILIKNDNIYKLSDFGLAGVKNEKGVCNYKQIYTMHYPPEKLSGNESATEQADIYMFGVTLYRLLNSDSHLINQFLKKSKQEKQSIINGKLPDRDNYAPHVPVKMKKIINKCLNIDLSKRYATIRDVKKDFGKLKIECRWELKEVTDQLLRWDCYCDDKLRYELLCEKNKKNNWDINLYIIKNKKQKISKYCNKNISDKEMDKKLRVIFNDLV